MSQEIDKIIKIEARCPRCNADLSANVNLGDLPYEDGVSKVAILHGDPPHSLILYIDKEGNERGYEVSEFAYVLDRKEKLTEGDIIRFQEHIGVDSIAVMYSGMIADVPVYVISPVGTKKPVEFLRYYLKDYPEKIPILENCILDKKFAISVVDKDFYGTHMGEIHDGLVYSMVTGNILGNWELRHIKNFIRKTIKKGYRGLAERYSEAKRLKILFNKFYDKVVNSRYPLSLKEIKKVMELSNSEAKYLAELTVIKDRSLKIKIRDDLRKFFVF